MRTGCPTTDIPARTGRRVRGRVSPTEDDPHAKGRQDPQQLREPHGTSVCGRMDSLAFPRLGNCATPRSRLGRIPPEPTPSLLRGFTALSGTSKPSSLRRGILTSPVVAPTASPTAVDWSVVRMLAPHGLPPHAISAHRRRVGGVTASVAGLLRVSRTTTSPVTAAVISAWRCSARSSIWWAIVHTSRRVDLTHLERRQRSRIALPWVATAGSVADAELEVGVKRACGQTKERVSAEPALQVRGQVLAGRHILVGRAMSRA